MFCEDMSKHPDGCGCTDVVTAATDTCASMQKEIQLLAELAADLKNCVEPPPDRNCFCHTYSPCSDCFNYAHTREVLSAAQTILERYGL
jgi:hypothetical protein